MSTPYDSNSHLKKNKEHGVARPKYAQIIGSLMYLIKCTGIGIVLQLRDCISGFPNVLEGYSDTNSI